MTEKEVVNAVKDQHFGDDDLDAACITRLRDKSYDFGPDGGVARSLLDIIERLLGL